jgi:hypothetical protein
MLDNMVQSGFLKQNNRDILLSSDDPEEIIGLISKAPVFEDTKWIEKT